MKIDAAYKLMYDKYVLEIKTSWTVKEIDIVIKLAAYYKDKNYARYARCIELLKHLT